MSTALLVVAIACAFGALGSLLTGVIGISRTEFNRKHGNRLMRARVAFQFLAIFFLFLYWVTLPK